MINSKDLNTYKELVMSVIFQSMIKTDNYDRFPIDRKGRHDAVREIVSTAFNIVESEMKDGGI